jgi:hypothetical protein
MPRDRLLRIMKHYSPNWQKESWQTSEETSRYVRPERVNKWPNSMTDMMMMRVSLLILQSLKVTVIWVLMSWSLTYGYQPSKKPAVLTYTLKMQATVSSAMSAPTYQTT